MGSNAYEVLAIAMRYVFAALMVLIVLRAWRITVVDSRRASKLRRLSPDTGIIGEMLVIDGNERARRGMRYPVTLEGTIGASHRSDIRVRHSSVKSRHAFYQMTDEGLFVRGHAGARITDANGVSVRETLLHDGDQFRIGRVTLMLVLSEGDSAPEEISRRTLIHKNPNDPHARRENPPEQPEDDLFEAEADSEDLFMSDPAENHPKNNDRGQDF